MSHDHLFYEKEIVRGNEQEVINAVLKQFKHEPATDELKNTIYDALCKEENLGNINIPFKVLLKKDQSGVHPDYIEVMLDTRV